MKIKDKGTLPQSKMFFTMTNEFAKKALYYLIYSGTFYCSEKYKVSRENFNSYLFLYVKKGKMKFTYKDNQFMAPANSFVFLDCYHPHSYHAEEETIFDFFHFTGNSSREYFDLLYGKNGSVYPMYDNHIILDYVKLILKMAEQNEVDEHSVSITIQKILYELNQFSNFSNDSTENKIKQAILFLENHHTENIKLEDIANHVYLSSYYFTRIFKKHMDCSPIQYLINYRINNAKKLLHNTSLTINEISTVCGFNNTSHFVTTFKNHVSISPKKFRDIPF